MLPTESGNCGGVGVARSSVRPGAGGQFPELTDTMQVGGQCRVDRASHCGPGGHLRFLQGWARACLAHTVTSLVFIPEKRRPQKSLRVELLSSLAPGVWAQRLGRRPPCGGHSKGNQLLLSPLLTGCVA